jgi:hypothetical protein
MDRLQYQLSIRNDDGGARLDVESLITELEVSMRSRNGNYMNIAGMNLAIVKTLMNHINRLQDRMEELEGMIYGMSPEREAENLRRDPRYLD